MSDLPKYMFVSVVDGVYPNPTYVYLNGKKTVPFPETPGIMITTGKYKDIYIQIDSVHVDSEVLIDENKKKSFAVKKIKTNYTLLQNIQNVAVTQEELDNLITEIVLDALNRGQQNDNTEV